MSLLRRQGVLLCWVNHSSTFLAESGISIGRSPPAISRRTKATSTKENAALDNEDYSTEPITEKGPTIVPSPRKTPTHNYYSDSKLLYGDLLVGAKNRKQFIKENYSEKEEEKLRREIIAEKNRQAFDKTSLLLFGPRLKSIPSSMKLSEKMDAEQIVYVDELQSSGHVTITSDSFDDASNKNLEVKLKRAKESTVTRAVNSTVKEPPWLLDQDVQLDSDFNNLKPVSSSPKTSPVPKITTTSNRVDPKVVLLEKEYDLKALSQAPLMNKTRPNFVKDKEKLTFGVPMILKICPEALIGKPLAPEKFPSVTTILDVTMPPESRARLEAWRRKKIDEMGAEKFALYQEQMFEDGRNFHTAVEEVLNGAHPKKVHVSERNQGHWESLKNVFKDVSDVVSVEERTSHPHLCYKGVFDGVLSLEKTPCLVDWKTASTRKDTVASLYDNPIQVAAYLGAINFDDKFAEKQLQLDRGVVVVAYSSGEPASVIRFEPDMVQTYWNRWLRRLQQYWRIASIDKKLPERVRN